MSRDSLPLEVKGTEKSSEAKGKAGRPLLYIGAGALFIAVVLALGLGLGLGLGLKHHNHSASSTLSASTSTAASSSPSSTPTNVPSTASQVVQPWRRDTLDYSLDMTWDLNAVPTTRVFNLSVTQIDAAPDGKSLLVSLHCMLTLEGVVRPMLVFNGQFPGPLIEVNQGDRVLVNVTNLLPNSTSVHWHGLYQNGTNWMDGTVGITQCGIPPGQSFLYNFTVENQFGTYWYHSHESTQYTDGLVGPFIVHSPDEASVRQTYDFDQIVLLQDWYHDFTQALLPGYLASGTENAEPVPDNGLIQGTN